MPMCLELGKFTSPPRGVVLNDDSESWSFHGDLTSPLWIEFSFYMRDGDGKFCASERLYNGEEAELQPEFQHMSIQVPDDPLVELRLQERSHKELLVILSDPVVDALEGAHLSRGGEGWQILRRGCFEESAP